MKSKFVLALGFLLLSASVAVAQPEKEKPQEAKSKLDLTQPYLLLATTKTSTMQKELNEAAAAGYRLLVGSPTSGTEMALILEKVATPPDTYEYLLLATSRTSTMQKELNDAAEKGFRLLPRTMINKQQMFGGAGNRGDSRKSTGGGPTLSVPPAGDHAHFDLAERAGGGRARRLRNRGDGEPRRAHGHPGEGSGAVGSDARGQW